MRAKNPLFHIVAALFTTVTGVAGAQPANAPGHLRLVDNLDRPEDGYCVDVAGSGNHIRFDMPLTAHNCKPGLYADEAVVLEPNGYIRFPAYGACVTAAGINGRALPHASLVPRGCGERSPFLIADPLQRFVHRSDGRMELAGSGLCMTVGEQSDSTFEATHRWRPLYLIQCDQAELSLSNWKFEHPARQ